VPSLSDAMGMLARQAERTPPPQWVRVIGGWSEFQFAERRMPTLDEVNAAAPDTPVFILHLKTMRCSTGRRSGHSGTPATRQTRPAGRSSAAPAANRQVC